MRSWRFAGNFVCEWVQNCYDTRTTGYEEDLHVALLCHICLRISCLVGDNGKRHSAANGHLTVKHDIVGQQPGTAVARTTAVTTRLVVESEEIQIGAGRVQTLNTVLLLITACLPFVHVESLFFRILSDVNISAQNARRFVDQVYLSIVETIRGVLQKVVASSQGLKMFWWNADLWTCPSSFRPSTNFF